MERYAVSVKALYGERGAGKNRTLYIYTAEGGTSSIINCCNWGCDCFVKYLNLFHLN